MKKPNLGIIRELAKSQNISLKNISERLGISPAALQNIMRNNGTSLETLGKLADIFGVSIDVFFEGTTTPKPLLQKTANILLDVEYKKELVSAYCFIENMMDSITIDDKDEIYNLIKKRFEKIDKYQIFNILGKYSENEFLDLLSYIDEIEDKTVLKLAIYRIVYKRSGIEDFADFWFKYHKSPNRLQTISLKEN